MVSASTNLSCLLLLALGAEVVATDSSSIVVPPPDVTCPQMSNLGPGTYLSTEPWSFLRTINVMQKATVPGAADVKLGVVTTALWDWSVVYELRDIHEKLIAKIVNPAAFWDTTQDIYTCNGNREGSTEYSFEAKDMFQNRYSKRQVLDANGNHVADLAQEDETTTKHKPLLSSQFFIYLRDLKGNPLAAMRYPSGGWHIGLLGERFDVQIEVYSLNALAPLPATDPAFLSLILSSTLATGSRLGPYWGYIFNCVFGFSMIAVVLACGLRSRGGNIIESKGKEKDVEEKQGLLSTIEAQAEGTKQAPSVFACCSRRVAPQ